MKIIRLCLHEYSFIYEIQIKKYIYVITSTFFVSLSVIIQNITLEKLTVYVFRHHFSYTTYPISHQALHLFVWRPHSHFAPYVSLTRSHFFSSKVLHSCKNAVSPKYKVNRVMLGKLFHHLLFRFFIQISIM